MTWIKRCHEHYRQGCISRTSTVNWVSTSVSLRFWTNGSVIGTFFFFFLSFFLMIFYQFLTWMVFERLPNCKDYNLNNELHDLTSQKWNQVLQSLALAGLLTLLVARAPSVWWCCFQFPLDTVRCVTAPSRPVTPSGCVLSPPRRSTVASWRIRFRSLL